MLSRYGRALLREEKGGGRGSHQKNEPERGLYYELKKRIPLATISGTSRGPGQKGLAEKKVATP